MMAPLHRAGSAIHTPDWPTLAQLQQELIRAPQTIRCASGQPLRFVPQAANPVRFEERYEPRAYLAGEVQTRTKNWHDLFNALVWMTFPRTKAALNRRHYMAATAEAASPGNRSRSRDAFTLFDESGVAIACSRSQLADLLHAFRWQELFWERRAEVVSHMNFVLFGHSLYEKALAPYIGLTGHGLVFLLEDGFHALPEAERLTQLDGLMADYFNAEAGDDFNPSQLAPVPLLGIPGWWAGNRAAEFYADTRYFRPGRRSGRPR
ncbi:MAG: DUF3025 domain-containing protein [Sulfuricellaceae bacterium]|nr:DUF3025 domain-containing protein [Sulfuricellaceae bacterium]